MKRKRLLIGTFALLLAMMVAGGVVVLNDRTSPPPLNADEIHTVVLVLQPREVDEVARSYRSEDRQLITSLVEQITGAKPTTEHRCADVATLIFESASDEQVTLRLMSGPHDTYHEFRTAGGLFRLPRPPFGDSLDLLGLPPGIL